MGKRWNWEQKNESGVRDGFGEHRVRMLSPDHARHVWDEWWSARLLLCAASVQARACCCQYLGGRSGRYADCISPVAANGIELVSASYCSNSLSPRLHLEQQNIQALRCCCSRSGAQASARGCRGEIALLGAWGGAATGVVCFLLMGVCVSLRSTTSEMCVPKFQAFYYAGIRPHAALTLMGGRLHTPCNLHLIWASRHLA